MPDSAVTPAGLSVLVSARSFGRFIGWVNSWTVLKTPSDGVFCFLEDVLAPRPGVAFLFWCFMNAAIVKSQVLRGMDGAIRPRAPRGQVGLCWSLFH